MKSAGKLVSYTTKENKVQKGRTYNRDNLVNGKVVVHLLTDDLHHETDEKGQAKNVLVDASKLRIYGFID